MSLSVMLFRLLYGMYWGIRLLGYKIQKYLSILHNHRGYRGPGFLLLSSYISWDNFAIYLQILLSIWFFISRWARFSLQFRISQKELWNRLVSTDYHLHLFLGSRIPLLIPRWEPPIWSSLKWSSINITDGECESLIIVPIDDSFPFTYFESHLDKFLVSRDIKTLMSFWWSSRGIFYRLVADWAEIVWHVWGRLIMESDHGSEPLHRTKDSHRKYTR